MSVFVLIPPPNSLFYDKSRDTRKEGGYSHYLGLEGETTSSSYSNEQLVHYAF